MSVEFDALKVQVAAVADAVQKLVAKVETAPAPVFDPNPADVVAATEALKVAVDQANAILNPPAAPAAS